MGVKEMVRVTAGTSGARDGVLNADRRRVRRGVARGAAVVGNAGNFTRAAWWVPAVYEGGPQAKEVP